MAGRRAFPVLLLGVAGIFLLQQGALGAPALPDLPIPSFQVGMMQAEGARDVVLSLQLLGLLTILTVAPAIILMLTSFTRIVVVLGFVRNALALQQTPPNQVIVALALFLTFFVMTPVLTDIYDNALQPYLNEQISTAEAWEKTVTPVRNFILQHTRDKELSLMVTMAGMERPRNASEVAHAGAYSSLRAERAENGLPDGYRYLRTFYRGGYDRGEHSYGHGNDHASSHDDIPSLQSIAFRYGGRMEPGHFQSRRKFFVLNPFLQEIVERELFFISEVLPWKFSAYSM